MPRRPFHSILLVAAASSVGAALANAEEKILDRQQIVRELTRSTSATRGIAVESARTPPVFSTATLPAIKFEYDSARLTDTARRQVRELGAALEMAPLDRLRFAVQGHTDSRGAATYNRDLSLRRAQSVQHGLVDAGIPSARLTPVGLGEDFPRPGLKATDAGNRRVEIVNVGPRRLVERATNMPPADAKALLIGIDRYTTVSSLMGAPTNDIEAMRTYLREDLGMTGANIRTLRDADATRRNILHAIEDWLIPGTGYALLYFSGHGFQERDSDGDEQDGWDETLVPVDVQVTNGVANGMISDDEIAVLLARRAGKTEVIIDACHSGTLTRSAVSTADWRFVKSPRLPDGQPLRLLARTRGDPEPSDASAEVFLDSESRNLTVWTAVRADQKALVDGESAPHFASVFTRRLLSGSKDGAADANQDGTVTARELQTYLRAESAAYCDRNRQVCAIGGGLTPQLSIGEHAVDQPIFAPLARANATPALPPVAGLAKDILIATTNGRVRREGGVTVRVQPRSRLLEGEEIEVVVESDRAGVLVLLDIDANGQLVQVFPNERSLLAGVSPRIAAGETVTLPGSRGGFRFVARSPTGRGMLVAVVADDESRLAVLTARHKDLAVIPRPDAFIVELAGHLRRWGRPNWGYGDVAYEIVER